MARATQESRGARRDAPAVDRLLEIEHEDLDAYTRQGVAIYASVDASPRLKLGQSYGLRLSADQYDETSGSIRNAVVLSGFAVVRSDTTDQRLDARDNVVRLIFAENDRN